MFKDSSPEPRKGVVSQSRRLRRTMSLPEVLLWRELRAKPSGLKFRRQHPTGPYSLDFYCADARLAIEVDGEAHGRGDRPERDEARDAWLARAGIETLRIPAQDVLHDLEAVLRGIVAQAIGRLPLHHPAAAGGPLPLHRPAAGPPSLPLHRPSGAPPPLPLHRPSGGPPPLHRPAAGPPPPASWERNKLGRIED